jgi:hypothetical protein
VFVRRPNSSNVQFVYGSYRSDRRLGQIGGSIQAECGQMQQLVELECAFRQMIGFHNCQARGDYDSQAASL